MIDILIQKPFTSSFSAGVLGEHNFRQLKIELPTELQGADSYILEFEQNGKAVVSDELSEIEGYVYYPIGQDVSTLSDKYVNATLTGYFGDNIGKSLKFSLRFENAVNVDGAEIIDGVEKGIVEQAFEIADKFGETEDGQPTYNGEPITADTSNFLAKDNTEEFIPTADYNPATKKYVDDNAGGGGINIVATVNDLPVSPTEGDLLYLKATGKFITNIPKTTLSGILYSDNDLNGKIYPKLFFNPSPNTDGLAVTTDTCLSIFAGVPESITVNGIENFEGIEVQIECMPISSLDETYTGTESIVIVMIMDDINETEENYLFTHQDILFPIDDTTIDLTAGWNQVTVRFIGRDGYEDIYEYSTIPCDEPPALKSAVIYRSEWDDGDYDGALAALAELLQPNPYYIDLPSGVIGHFDGLWQPQDYPSNGEFEKTVEKIKHTYKSETDLLKEDVSNLKTDSHKHQNKVLLEKFSEDSEGGLLYNGEPVGGGIDTVFPRTVGTYNDLPFVPNTGEEMYYVLGDSEEVVGTKVSPDFTGVDSTLLFFDKLMIKESPEAPTISPTELDGSYVKIYIYDKNGLRVNDRKVSLECFDGINFVLSVNEGDFTYAWNSFSFNDGETTFNFTQGWNKYDESQNVVIPCNFSEVLNTFDFVTVRGGINYNHVSPFFDTYDIPCIKHPEGLYAYNHETWNQVSFGKTKVVDVADIFELTEINLMPVDNTLYNFGSLDSLYIDVINDGVNLFHITFSTANACNVALPDNVVWAGETPDFAANSLCEISFARIKTADGYKFVARGSAVEVTA